MPTLESLGIDKMTTVEKQAVIEAIEETIPDDDGRPMLTPELQAFLQKRIEYAEQNPDDWILATDFIAELRASLDLK